MTTAQYGELGEAAWAWVLGQVQWDDDGPWIPEAAGGDKPEEYRDGMHAGVGGLAHALAEIRLARAWTAEERELAAAIADRIRRAIPAETSITYFDGLVIPWEERHGDEFTHNWCHGGAGTSLLFRALEYAGVDKVAGETPAAWHRRCLDGVRHSGVPERLYPGFWDNNGRCCGTAGVGDVFLDSWHRDGDKQDLEFAVRLGDALVERAFHEDGTAYWRFVEHRNEDPLLPPGVGWMQGAAGIAAYLLRLQRVLDGGREAVERMDNWWALTAARPRQS